LPFRGKVRLVEPSSKQFFASLSSSFIEISSFILYQKLCKNFPQDA